MLLSRPNNTKKYKTFSQVQFFLRLAHKLYILSFDPTRTLPYIPRKMAWRDNISAKIHPTDHMSTLTVYCRRNSINSGARYHLVMTYCVISSSLVGQSTPLWWLTARAIPSNTFNLLTALTSASTLVNNKQGLKAESSYMQMTYVSPLIPNISAN